MTSLQSSSLAEELQSLLGCSALFAQLLVARGFSSVQAVQNFLAPSLKRDWRDPFELSGMDAVVSRLEKALDAQEHICVFGDFDLDGISATALLVRALRQLGAAQVSYVIPRRLGEGYGLNHNTLPKLIALSPDLVVTVDNGVSADVEIQTLLASGIDVVVTDHHEPGDHLPRSVPMVNPKLDVADTVEPAAADGYPPHFVSELCGAAVALKVVQALGIRRANTLLWLEYLDLAAMGTVADVIQLTGESRALVAAGLQQMKSRPIPGIAALADQLTTFDLADVTADRIAFVIAPRLNAAGRVSDPLEALDLLLADDPDQAATLASRLIERNQERQQIEKELEATALQQLQRSYDGQRALVLAGAGWHEGVRGIVASRLAERYGVPTIIASINDQGIAEGSARTVGSVDLFKALSSCSELFDYFGGHAAAAGLTLKASQLAQFEERLLAYLDALSAEEFVQEKTLDLSVQLKDLNFDVAQELQQLEPCGAGNPRPVFQVKDIDVAEAKVVGADGTHLRFAATQGEARVPAIWFRAQDIEQWTGGNGQAPSALADALFRLEKDTFRGRQGVQLQIISMTLQGDDFLRGLYGRADQIIQRREYAGITDVDSFHTKLVGVTFEGRQELVEKLQPGEALELVRDSANDFDRNAIAVVAPRLRGIRGGQLGFLNRDLVRELAPAIDAGTPYTAVVADITGGTAADDSEKHSRGVNVLIARADADAAAVVGADTGKAQRAHLDGLPLESLHDELRQVFIGENTLHAAQADTLQSLAQGHNTLTVMATGRGKSLIFHMHAAVTAIKQRKPSIFVYPLRALVSDQAFHLEQAFAKVGIQIAVITGETDVAQREDSYAQLSAGHIDIVLTTPEYLHFHAESFAQASDVGFVVIDEAHHIGQSKAGNRPAYGAIGQAIEKLGSPVTLAVTATAGTEVAARICETLHINKRVLDPHVRENLHVVDKRAAGKGNSNFKHSDFKQNYLLQLAETTTLADGSKLVVYVNSRAESVRLARSIRKTLPDLAWKTAFYNGGMKRDERAEVEKRFREGDIQVVIATSAFGEGVNIPDIRNVVLFHFPFSAVEFNQMSGRGGRDGKPAYIHLLFSEEDASINRFILLPLAPPRLSLAALYKVLRTLTAEWGNGFKITNRELAELGNDQLRQSGAFDNKTKGKERRRSASSTATPPSAEAEVQVLREESVSQGLGIFRELGLVTTAGHSSARTITLVQDAAKVDLQSSVRYREGQDEQADFEEFRRWALLSTAEQLRKRFTRPILPE
ncbi:MAG: single-stranded-DNA-specific exonuclease RecJ [Coriobacteriia bacterium]|nr:single-stranded-DNA-specific exonuclease RecJ [Coriobacteriia bacterium]